MNFIFLFGALALVCLPIAVLIEDKASWGHKDWSIPFFMVGIVSLATLVILIAVCAINNVTAASENAEMLETQKALEFKLESADIRDEFGLLNKSFVDDVETYNKKLIHNKSLSENPWVSAFHPKKVVEGCERIDYEKFVKK